MVSTPGTWCLAGVAGRCFNAFAPCHIDRVAHAQWLRNCACAAEYHYKGHSLGKAL